MRLTENNKGTIDFKVWRSINNVEDNVDYYNWDIEDTQDIWILSLVTSNYLIENVYDEINRE